MEEILASIRRIIADDEAKPVDDRSGAETLKSAPAPVMTPTQPRPGIAKEPAKVEPPKPQVVAVKQSPPAPSSLRPTPQPVAAKPAPVAAASNNQDDIDAMMAGFGEMTPSSDIEAAVPDSDVFELTDEMALPDRVPTSFRKVDPQEDIEFGEASSRFRQASSSPSPEAMPDLESQIAPNILSRSTVSAVESAFNSLANTVLSNNARTLEDLVKEMLRPMLKTWLDDNLPGVVERIVKTEIERVSRGR